MKRCYPENPTMPRVVEYNSFVKTTDVAEEDFTRYMLGLVGEIGEIAEKRKKELRGDGLVEDREYLKELGDVLWYLTRMSHFFGSNIEEIMCINMEKLRKRQENNTIQGDGDGR